MTLAYQSAMEAKRALQRKKFQLLDEDLLQQQIAAALTDAQIPYQREAVLSKENRIDFLLENQAGIEVKINRAGTSLLQQLERYCLCEQINALLVITIRPADLPQEIHKTPLINLALWNKLDIF